jgi:hypothetical protein
MNNNPYYRFFNNEYHFFLGGEELFQCPSVAILVDGGCNVLLRHGREEIVREKYEELYHVYIKSGNVDCAMDLDVILLTEENAIMLEELNKTLAICDYNRKLNKHYNNNTILTFSQN